MKTGKLIPIAAAKRISEDYGYSQIIIHAYDGETGIHNVTTYGKSLSDCENAAKGGNAIKKLLGWENSDAVPERIKVVETFDMSRPDKLVGMHRSDVTEILKNYTGTVRIINPGQPITMDHELNRLNISFDTLNIVKKVDKG